MSNITITLNKQEANFILQAIDHVGRMGIVNEITNGIANKIIEAQK